jgi:hypothetical protein
MTEKQITWVDSEGEHFKHGGWVNGNFMFLVLNIIQITQMVWNLLYNGDNVL